MPPKRTVKETKSPFVDEEDDSVAIDIEDYEPEIEDELPPEEEKTTKSVKGGDAEDDADPTIDFHVDIEAGQPITQVDQRALRVINIVPNDQRVTTERIQSYEMARIIGDRAAHLDNGAPPYIDDAKKYSSSIHIAYVEFMQRRIPFKIYRHVGDVVEVWRLKEMTIGNIVSLEDMI